MPGAGDVLTVGTDSSQCPEITKIAFGGDDLRTAFATSARKGLDAAALAEQPEAGNVFALEAGVAGLAVTPVAAF